jgi:GTPase SAR1 family protein
LADKNNQNEFNIPMMKRRNSVFGGGRLVQIVLLGNEGVGKSTFMSELAGSEGLEGDSTEGVDVWATELGWINADYLLDVRLRAVELAGNREYLISAARLARQDIGSCQALVFCVDLTNLNSMASFGFVLKTVFFDLDQRHLLA